MPPASTCPLTLNTWSDTSSTSPDETIATFSFGIPILSAMDLFAIRCRYSPWIGIAYFGFKREYINLISSWQACPETWVSCKMTSAPFIANSLTTLATAFSFPGIGVELIMTTSSGIMLTFRWTDDAILDKAAILSPWLPVVIKTVFSGG